MDLKKKKIIFLSAVGVAVLALIITVIAISVPKKDPGTIKNSSVGTSLESSEASSENMDSSSDESVSQESIASGSPAVSGGASNKPVSNAPNTSSKNNVSNTISTTIQGGFKPLSGTIDATKYNLFTWSRNYWEGKTVYNESVYPMTTESGENEVIQLMYDASKIIDVRTSDLKTVYKAGVDYKLENGKIIIPKGSAIKVNTYQEYYPTIESSTTQAKSGGGFIFFSEGDVFHKKQIAVTYEHTANWNGPVPTGKISKLPNLKKQLEQSGQLNMVVFGDSISCGANASATVNALPNTPSWPDLFRDAIREMGVSVTFNNPSVGGQASGYGAEKANIAIVNRNNPDLVVLGWGMNDGGFWHGTSASSYKENIVSAIKQIRAANPEAEFILIGTIWPNSEAKYFYNLGAYQQYTNKLYEIEKEYSGVAVASMTEIHKHLLTRKNYRDMSGNNINHPNDFITRLYLQVLLKTIS